VNPQALWAFAHGWYGEHSARDRRIIAGVGLAVALSIVYVGVVDPLRAYRRRVTEEIGEGHDRLERFARFVGAVDALRAERAELKKRLAQAQSRLLPATPAPSLRPPCRSEPIRWPPRRASRC